MNVVVAARVRHTRMRDLAPITVNLDWYRTKCGLFRLRCDNQPGESGLPSVIEAFLTVT